MTTSLEENILPRRSALGAAVGLLLVLAWSHFIVDVIASIIMPLWPKLETRLAGSVMWLYVLWTLATSITQLGFGYLGDRRWGRQLIWIGPLVAIVCMSAIGLATSPLALAALTVVGGLGIAAFHPEAAVMAGNCVPENRSRAMAVFAVGGFLGQAAGPYYAGWLTDRLGMSGLLWSIPFGFAGMIFLLHAMRARQRQDRPQDHAPSVSIAQLLRGKMRPAMAVLAIGTLRVVTLSGIPLALAFLLAARSYTSGDIGWVQSWFMAGVGAGGLACGLCIGRTHERRALFWLPLPTVPLVVLIPNVGHHALILVAILSALLLGVTLPVLISYGQQLLTGSQRVASSISMGVSWGLGGGIAAALFHFFQTQMDTLFMLFAIASLASSLISLALPDLSRD